VKRKEISKEKSEKNDGSELFGLLGEKNKTECDFSGFCTGVEVIPLSKYIDYAYLVENLEIMSSKYDDLMGFIYVIK